MAIAAKISELYIKKKDFNVNSDFIYLITPTNFDVSLAMLNFGSDNDEAIDGSLRSNLRGFRMQLSIPHEILVSSTIKRATRGDTGNPENFSFNFAQEVEDGGFSFSNSTIDTFFSDLVTAFKTDDDDFVEVSFDGVFDDISQGVTLKDFRKIIIDSSSFKTVFTNQISRDSSDLKFVGQKKLTSIPSELQAT